MRGGEDSGPGRRGVVEVKKDMRKDLKLGDECRCEKKIKGSAWNDVEARKGKLWKE